jgi:molybdopterin-containing oxidoreductase family iron-sulfur binding subunit
VATRIGQALTPIDGLEINFRRDPTIYDGRYANNGWLQELPKPMSKLTWDTAAHIAPSTAEANSLHNGDVIAISQDGRSIHAPVFVMPGHAKGSITITVGYGRKYAGRLGSGLVNAYQRRGSSALFFGAAAMTGT